MNLKNSDDFKKGEMRMRHRNGKEILIMAVLFLVLFIFMGCNESDDGGSEAAAPIQSEELAEASPEADVQTSGEKETTASQTGTDVTPVIESDESDMEQVVGTGTLRISEIVAKDGDGGYDWVELIASGDGPVSLKNYALTDDKEDRVPESLPDLTLLPGEYIVVAATEEAPEDGTPFVAFALGSDDAVTLYLEGAVVDILDWEDGQAPSGYSYGRYPDGSNQGLLDPTPGMANIVATITPVVEPEEDAASLFPKDRVITVSIEISEADWQDILADPMAEEEKPATIIYDGRRVENVSIRTKGNSSLNSVARSDSNRYSFKIDFNTYVQGQDLLGIEKLNLNNNFKDPSYMRERIAYDLMRFLDIPAPRTTYANIEINGELFGLYTIVEPVDDEFVKDRFEITDGDLYKPEGVGASLAWLGEGIGNYPGLEIQSNEETSDHSAILSMIRELNLGYDYESVIDVDMFLRYLAVSTLLANLDSYQGSAHNYYLYEQEGVFTLIPWDLNEAFGSFSMGCTAENLLNLMIDEPTMVSLEERPLAAKILTVNEYRIRYHEYLESLIDGLFSPEIIEQTILETADLIRLDVAADPTKFFSLQEFETSLYTDVGNIFGLMRFVENRSASVQNQLTGASPAAGDGSGNCETSQIPNGNQQMPPMGGGGTRPALP